MIAWLPRLLSPASLPSLRAIAIDDWTTIPRSAFSALLPQLEYISAPTVDSSLPAMDWEGVGILWDFFASSSAGLLWSNGLDSPLFRHIRIIVLDTSYRQNAYRDLITILSDDHPCFHELVSLHLPPIDRGKRETGDLLQICEEQGIQVVFAEMDLSESRTSEEFWTKLREAKETTRLQVKS